MSRERISIALADDERADLYTLAASRQMAAARLAGELVAEGMDRVRRRNAAARAATEGHAHSLDLVGIDIDIHAALTTPGVVAALIDPEDAVSSAALRALTFLRDVSAWLDDPRPYMDRPRPPRLADPVTSHQHRGPIAAAIARAGGGDERARSASAAHGLSGMSDKALLSNIAPTGREEAGDGQP